MNQKETLAAITKLNSIDAQLGEVYRSLHRQDEFTLAESNAIERIELMRAELCNVVGPLRRQHSKYVKG